MKNFKKIWLVSFLSIYLLAGALLFAPAQALAESSVFDVTQDVNFEPQVGVPDSEFVTGEKVPVGGKAIDSKGNTVVRSDLLAKYINAFYKWGLNIVAIIAVLVLMAGGLMWIASGGDSGLITKAKELVIGSLTGMALLIGAWFFLNTINPNLTKLPAIEMVIINKTVIGCCEYSNKAKMDSEEICKKDGGTYKLSEIDKESGEAVYYLVSGSQCALPGCCITDPGTPNAICINRREVDCKSALLQSSSAVSYVTGSCTNQIKKSLCKQGDWCQGAKNGSACSTKGGYCYSGLCWIGNGEENEPCGDEPNAMCSKEFSWIDNPNDDQSSAPTAACTKKGYKHDNFGGRDCGLGFVLACCYPE